MIRERASRRDIVVPIVAAASIILNIVAAAVDALSWPAFELGGFYVWALVGIVYAICAVIVTRMSRQLLPAVLMLTASVANSFAGLWTILSPVTWLWVLPYSAIMLPQAVVIVLALIYPTGRIDSTLSRIIVAVVATNFIVGATIRTLFYDPGGWGWCDCAVNPLAAIDEPVVGDLLGQSAVWGRAIVIVAAFVIVAIHWARGSKAWRTVNVLMTVAFTLLTATWLLYEVLYLTGGQTEDSLSFYLTLTLDATIPIIYVASLARERQTRARVADLILAAREGLDRPRWRAIVIEILDDPTASILWWDRRADGYVDDAGASSTPPPPGPGVLHVRSGSAPLAVVTHDPALATRSELLASVAEAVRLSSENQRLAEDLDATLAQVRESRARIVEAGDEARKRIERDLHDGAQQLLVSAAVSLSLAREGLEGIVDPELERALERAGDQLALARRELRDLARGITPIALDHGGIESAVQELAVRASVPTSVRVTGEHPLSRLAARTIYFVVSECLTNTTKHAAATVGDIAIHLADPVTVSVSDNGAGGADAHVGTGLRGIIDRVEALGGNVRIGSGPAGTTITAVIPASAESAVAEPAS